MKDVSRHRDWRAAPPLALLLAWVLGAVAAAEPVPVRLTLEGAAEDATPLVLDLTLRDGRFDEEVWATAWQYNRGIHAGTVAATAQGKDQWHLAVKLTLESDNVAPGGAASYQIDLARKGDQFTGTHAGLFLDWPVKGAVTGHPARPYVRAVAGCEPAKAGEHPRLIFRKTDLPELRRRMETPEGRAIMEMLRTRAPLREASQVTDRHTSWMAANWGAIYQLTGDADAARKARDVLLKEVISKPLPDDRKEIHRASRLLGIALTYDLCFEAWDPEYRGLLAEYLQLAAAELAAGYNHGFQMDPTLCQPDPWCHRNAIRMGCAGVAALAILGDPDAAGKPLPDVERIARLCERHVAAYLRSGVSQSGCGLEGAFFRDFALANGVLQFLQASRVSLGRDLADANPFLLAGAILNARLEAPNTYDFGLASISVQASGLWPMGLGSAPREFLPVLRWCCDRDVGLSGKLHFGCAYPYQAAYALANYPFATPAQPPGQALPLLNLDREQGHFLFRQRWQDADDAWVELYLNLQSRPVLRLKSGDLTTGALNVAAFGTTWLRGFPGPSRLNDAIGAELLYADAAGQQAFVGMDLTRCFTVAPERPRPSRIAGSKGAGVKQLPKNLPTPEQIRDFLNTPPPPAPPPKSASAPPKTGVALVRHVAVDLSGECGAPVLIALVDRGEGLAEPWRVPLPGNVASATAGQFVSGEANAANLAGRFVFPADAKLSGGRIPAQNEVFLVMTIQRGPAPAVRIEGTGLGAKAVVGGRTILFNGQRIVFGK